jgi:Protein of unknown function (DUF3572)
MRAPKTDRSSTGFETARDLAIEALGFLAADGARLERFLAVTGLGPHNLRRSAADPAFLVAVLDYLAADERLIVAFAAATGRKPEDVMRTYEAVQAPPPEAST